MKRTPWARAWLAASLLGLALGIPAAPAPIPVRLPPPPAAANDVTLPLACGYNIAEGSNSTAQAIPDHVGAKDGVITSTIMLTPSLPYIWTVALLSSVTHDYSSDLEMTLISPAGTRMTLTSRNGGAVRDVFSETLWADLYNLPVTDANFNGPLSLPTEFVPEEAFGAFRGENGTGPWKLVVADKAFHDTGTFHGWLLEVLSLVRPPITSTTTFTATPAASIPTSGPPLRLTLPVSGLAQSLLSVNLTAHITHSQTNALNFWLQSPEALSTTISTGNGGSFANWFNGTRWDDTAGKLYPPGPVTDDVHSSSVLTAAVPEGALGHFVGTDPNGNWSLGIKDVLAVGGGSVAQWGLDITTGYCPGGVYLPLVSQN